MSDGDDTLGSLPPPRVKWKMEDIKEATLEGSQFEAQFPEEKTSVPVNLVSPRQPTPKQPQPSQTVTTPSNVTSNRPKTTLRRSGSEKTVTDQTGGKSPPPSRKSSLDISHNPTNQREVANTSFMSRRMSSQEGAKLHTTSSIKKINNDSPAVSRKSTQELLTTSSSESANNTGRRSSQENVRTFTVLPSKTNSARNHHLKDSEKQNGTHPDRNGYTNRSEPSSRVSSQLSLHRPNSFAKSENGQKALHSSEVVQAKGRVMEHGWYVWCYDITFIIIIIIDILKLCSGLNHTLVLFVQPCCIRRM